MYISKKDREFIKRKFQGKCAYSGTELGGDWQIDHVKPIIRNRYDGTVYFKDEHNLKNMVPSQKLINHYKGSMDLELFRTWYLAGLHNRLKKLPKNPKTEKSIKRKAYLLAVAGFFDIEIDKPFSGKFYFETVISSNTK